MANSQFTCNLDVWVDGATIHAQMHYHRDDYYTYQDSSFPNPTMTIAGETFTDTGFGDWVRSGIGVGDVRTTEFTKTVSANGTYEVVFSAGSGQRSDFAGTWYGSAIVTAAYTNPNISSVTVNSKTYNSVNLTVRGDYGIGTGYKQIEAGLSGSSSWVAPLRSQAIFDGRTTYTVTVDNGSTRTTSLTLIGNQRLWYGGYISNGYSGGGVVKGEVYLPCPPLSTLSLSSQEYSDWNKVIATISWRRQTDGGAQARTGYYRYSMDGGANYSDWTSFGAVSDTTGTFDVELPTASDVLLQAKLQTSNGGDSAITSTTFTTSTTHTAPSFSKFTYVDASSVAVSVSGDDQLFIQGQSQPKITIVADNKAIASDGAKITSYTASLNAVSIQIPYSDNETVTGAFGVNTPDASGALALTVAANDSLNLSTAVSQNITVIPWSAPILDATAERTNSFESETTLKIKGVYAPVEINGTVKNTLAVAYRYKKSTASTWGDWVARPVTITDDNFEATDLVLTFDNEAQWDIQVRAVDKFTTTIQDITLSIGRPIFFISRNKKCSINRKPTNNAADLDVEGMIYSQDQPVMTSHVGMVIMSTTLTTAAEVKAVYGGYWTAYNGISTSGLYCWRRTS